MNVLLVLAHPEPASYNGHLARLAVETLTAAGHTVEVSDLYRQRFAAVAGPADLEPAYATDFFDLQAAQRAGVAADSFEPGIEAEMEKLRRADLLMLQFPLWWHSVPAILKGWIDRVLAVGFAYGGTKELAGKKALVSLTSGTPNELWDGVTLPTLESTLSHLLRGTFAFCGMEVYEPFMIGSAKHLGPEQRAAADAEFVRMLQQLDTRKRIFLP
ncbi:NAD(P)H-dependent oxidoreductase [Hymenobacter latericus]|uniref:NAD(P)H-dependent oxidoreductase n=1 Tax=Hymenobacter sp. YIM 151858-1 TaxID=2987688 RepID=UPI0022261323|nr:NAD(P)H-dependent oxidoreductase [Hymenobacter sp. YIM 151858-1]UYZ60340.1 NAD(P)H-dependent oxidoreductase [Hymenobacter sp. YIM 151858-1]